MNIKLNLDNAAMDRIGVAEILRDLASKVESGAAVVGTKLRDSNGNIVGYVGDKYGR
jgi:hypothetical protein